MGQNRQLKKLKQAGRRQAKEEISKMESSIKVQLIKQYFKPKPKYCPLWLWKWGQKFYIVIPK